MVQDEKKQSKADTQSRKWQLTINNPEEHNFDHDTIKKKLEKFKNLIYSCFCDEIGENGTFHTHIYLQFSSSIRFSTLKKSFDVAHIEPANGTAQQNKDYIKKEGKWETSKKKETNIPESFEELGEMPVERQGKRNDLDALYDMIKSDMTNAQIIEADTTYMLNIDKIERVRQAIREEKAKNTFRKLQVHYIYGPAGTGKTRYVMDNHGYSNVCKITNYDSHPFDAYKGESVLLLDEYRSQLKIGDMLQYLDGYPLNLPARYGDRVALYETVYIVSNIPLQSQYIHVQQNEYETWNAFCRRITDCTYISHNGSLTFKVGSSGAYIPDNKTIECEIFSNKNKVIKTGFSIFNDDFFNDDGWEQIVM